MCECGERGGRVGTGDHRMSNMSMCGCMCVWERRHWGSEDEWCGCMNVVRGE